jgi:hypothetical protein
MENNIAELELRVAVIEQRLSRLEGAKPTSPEGSVSQTSPELDTNFLSNAPTHIGKVLLIFGGAFLLRAITEEQIVPTAIGIVLGTSYALFWLSMAYRIGRDKSRGLNALFYGASSVFLALPLFVEATTRFELLTGRQGVIALTVFCALAISVAVARNLRSFCWVVTAGSIITAFVVLNTSHSAVETAAFLLLLGLATLWAVYRLDWSGVQWLGALGANAGVLVLAVLSVSDRWSVQALTPFSMGVLLLVAYLASFAVRTHIRGQFIGVFEIVQAAMVVIIAFLTAVTAFHGGRDILLEAGCASLLLSACAYAMAFTPQTRTRRGRNFYFYSTIGLVLVVAGSALVVSPSQAAAAWSLMALAMAWLSGRYGRVALSLQCTFLLVTAGIASGILATGFEALAGGALGASPGLSVSYAIVALTTVACLFIPVAQRSDRWGMYAGFPQLVVLALSVWEVGGLMVLVAAPLLANTNSANADLAVLAALRTGILAASSVTLALSSRYRRWPESRWLVYPVLILVGFKLFLEDFPNGRPVTLFVAFAFVGSALILVAKLLQRTTSVTDLVDGNATTAAE